MRDERPRRLVAAHDFDDDVRVGVGYEVGRGVGQQRWREAIVGAPVQASHGDAGEGERAAVVRAQPVGMLDERIDDGPADRAGPEHRDAQRRTAHDGTVRRRT